jgi:hypothetical protein
MKQFSAQRVQPQPVRIRRAIFSKFLTLALILSFFIGLTMSQAPAVTAAFGHDAQIVSLNGSGGTPPDDSGDYTPIGHTVHCVGHVVQIEAVVVEPVRTSNQASFTALYSINSLSDQNPPERPPRA